MYVLPGIDCIDNINVIVWIVRPVVDITCFLSFAFAINQNYNDNDNNNKNGDSYRSYNWSWRRLYILTYSCICSRIGLRSCWISCVRLRSGWVGSICLGSGWILVWRTSRSDYCWIRCTIPALITWRASLVAAITTIRSQVVECSSRTPANTNGVDLQYFSSTIAETSNIARGCIEQTFIGSGRFSYIAK